MFFRRGSEIRISLRSEEADVLRKLIREFLELLGTAAPVDPVIKRLFPEASKEDPEISRQFRELASGELDALKRRNARSAAEDIGESGTYKKTITSEEAEVWVTLLTDLRLAIGARLDVTEEMMEHPIDPSDPDDFSLALLHYLGGLQESLVHALSDGDASTWGAET